MKKIKKIIIQTLSNMECYWHEYFSISMILIITLTTIFSLLIYRDTISNEELKYLDDLPEHMVILNTSAESEENMKLEAFFANMRKIKNIRETNYYYEDVSKTSNYYVNEKDSQVSFQKYYVDKDFFRFPVKLNSAYNNSTLLYGRYFNDSDNVNDKKIIISELTSNLIFGTNKSLNQYMYVYTNDLIEEKYQVIGIVSTHKDEYDNYLSGKENNLFILPIYVPQNTLQNYDSLNKITYFETDKTDEVMSLVNSYDIKNISITDNMKIEKEKKEYENFKNEAFILLLLSIILAFNIQSVFKTMLYSRKKEIGIKRSLGATKIDIFIQFIIETTFVLLLNLAVSLMLSIFILYVIICSQKNITQDMVLYMTPYTLYACLGMTLCQCISLSLITAIRASNSDIIELLNREE